MKDFAELGASAERVVDAAEGLIQEHGYNGFSYDDARPSASKSPAFIIISRLRPNSSRSLRGAIPTDSANDLRRSTAEAGA